jgi:hypothetical protein
VESGKRKEGCEDIYEPRYRKMVKIMTMPETPAIAKIK